MASHRSLPRGQILNWQVTARTKAGARPRPAPPAPEARFLVLAADVVARIEKIRGEHPGNPLLIAALYANAGALDEAVSMLRAADPAAAQPFRESIQKIRRAE